MTWGSYQQAVATVEQAQAISKNYFLGLGFALNGRFVAGIDIDHCIIDGVINDAAQKLIKRFDSYSEVSPSGTGVRIFVAANFAGGCKTQEVEVYGTGRFLTVTGRHIEGTPVNLMPRQSEIDALVNQFRPIKDPSPENQKSTFLEIEDEAVVALAKQKSSFFKLITGDLSEITLKADGSPDLSAADMSFCCFLARHTRDTAQIDRILRSSPLYRDKWERSDYRDRTIAAALATVDLDTSPPADTFDWDSISWESANMPQEAPEMPQERSGQPQATIEPVKHVAPLLEYRFNPTSSQQFAATKYSQEWLVKRLLVNCQPAIVGGPKKSLKTSLLVDLTVSIASGLPFLDSFTVYKPRRVCLISGESGEATLQETANRVCAAKDVQLADLDNASWDFRLPKVSNERELVALEAGLKQHAVEIAIIDPLYLCLLAGGDKQASNLFDMGPLLLDVASACLEAGATPILTHHSIKSKGYDVMELEDLAFAGIQEFARQWLLVSRRQAYEAGSGNHRLWLNAGGSCGHGGLWAVDIKEGVLEEDFTGRTWQVEVLTRQEANKQKQAQAEVKDASLENQLIETVKSWAGDMPPTKTGVKQRLGWNDSKFSRVWKKLVDAQKVKITEGDIPGGFGSRKGAIVTIQ